MITALSHLNIVVDDIEYATEFYQRTLGFALASNSRGKMDYPSYRAATFARNAGFKSESIDLDIRFLKHPTAGVYLELMKYREPAGNQTVPSFQTNDLGGIRHVAFEVDDIDTAYSHIQAQPDARILR